MMAVTRNARNATQFCGSAIVSVPTGGRKKKLNPMQGDDRRSRRFDDPPGRRENQDGHDIRERHRRRVDLDQLGVQRREEGDETSGRDHSPCGNDATHDG